MKAFKLLIITVTCSIANVFGTVNPPYYIADRAVQALNNASEDMQHWKLEQLKFASAPMLRDGQLRQQLKFVIVRTPCLKMADQSRVLLDLCPVDENAPRMECTVNVLTNQEGQQQFLYDECHRLAPPQSVQQVEENRELVALKTVLVPLQQHQEDDGKDVNADKNARKRGGAKEAMKNAEVDAISRTRALMHTIEHTLKLKELEFWAKFRQFVSKFHKVYSNKKEVMKRFRMYRRNHALARKWQDVERDTAVYGETQFMDLSMSEFKKIFLPYKWPLYVPGTKFAAPLPVEALPSEWDWRSKGAVTPVKNQGNCGSCWAFSVTGNIEGQWALKREGGKLQALSEQELLDCDKLDMACQGGLPLQAYKEIIRIGGLEPENDYPYDARREKCHLNRSDIAAYINGSVQLPKDEVQMAQWLVKNGPISVGVNALPLQFYRHGISHPWRIFCSPQMLNHGVLIVGFGREGDKPFWIIKNSWSEHWGEQGYYRLYRGTNVCGIHEMATSAVIE